MIVFWNITKHGGIRIYNPDPWDVEHPHTTVYFGYSLKQAKQLFRKQYNLQRKHITWEEL